MNRKNVIITGLPGSGKTTLIKRLVDDLRLWNPVGFYTDELREAGERVGFELVSLEGSTRVLAHVRFLGANRVGKYGVDVIGFEEFLEALALQNHHAGLVVLDEIGKMECLSPKFVSMVRKSLDSKAVVLATVALRGEGLISELKRRPDAELFEIHPGAVKRLWSAIRETLLESLEAEETGDKG